MNLDFRISFAVHIYRKFGRKLADLLLNGGNYKGKSFEISHVRSKRQQNLSV